MLCQNIQRWISAEFHVTIRTARLSFANNFNGNWKTYNKLYGDEGILQQPFFFLFASIRTILCIVTGNLCQFVYRRYINVKASFTECGRALHFTCTHSLFHTHTHSHSYPMCLFMVYKKASRIHSRY